VYYIIFDVFAEQVQTAVTETLLTFRGIEKCSTHHIVHIYSRQMDLIVTSGIMKSHSITEFHDVILVIGIRPLSIKQEVYKVRYMYSWGHTPYLSPEYKARAGRCTSVHHTHYPNVFLVISHNSLAFT
jgi:hypothetical protein